MQRNGLRSVRALTEKATVTDLSTCPLHEIMLGSWQLCQ